MEHGVVIWNSGLTKSQKNDLEKIQKVSLKIILGDYSSYSDACKMFSVDLLSLRRTQLCTNFAVKLFKSDRMRDFFTPAEQSYVTRNENQLVIENVPRTTRCKNAPHNYLAKLVNQNITKIKKTI